jgi:hypothetical protein
VIILIAKERTIPLAILILAALLRRLPLSHAKYQEIFEEFKRRQAGYRGEQSLDYYFRSLPQKKYTLLHDLNLPDGDYNCQIDTFLLTPEFGLIVDIKNMKGKLVFDTDNQQFTQYYDGVEKGYPDPIAQAERHQEYIIKLLKEHHYPPVPIDYIVIISNPYATYVITGKNSSKVRPRICKADVFLSKIQLFEKLYTAPLLEKKDLRKICRFLIKMNNPPTKSILKRYGIDQSELLTGVFCPFCFHLSMTRVKKTWYCSSCGNFSQNAHIELLKDYFLLCGLGITNRQFRKFAHLSNIDTAGRLLRSENFNFTGSNRNRAYYPANLLDYLNN